jgi:endonuclease I
MVYSDILHNVSDKGIPGGWNREHLWPKSFGVGYSGADFSELMHLRPEDWNVNSARGNLYYGNCVGGTCVSPAHPEASADTAKNSLLFMPPVRNRGNVARAMFYMSLRYDGSDKDTLNLRLADCPCEAQNVMGKLSDLLSWHVSDPVDEQERLRNSRICTNYQGNRNVFIDFPELVQRIWSSLDAEVNCTQFVCTTQPVDSIKNSSDSSGLSAGDIAITRLVSDDPDEFSLLLLNDVKEAVDIYVTDNGFDGNSLRTTENVVYYTVPEGGLPAGTVLDYPSKSTPNLWKSYSGSLALSVDGDQLIVFTGSPSNPTFLYALNYKNNSWSAPGSVKSTVVAFIHFDDMIYNGPKNGTKEQMLQFLSNSSNWKFSNSERFPAFNGSFSVYLPAPLPTSVPTLSPTLLPSTANPTRNPTQSPSLLPSNSPTQSISSTLTPTMISSTSSPVSNQILSKSPTISQASLPTQNPSPFINSTSSAAQENSNSKSSMYVGIAVGGVAILSAGGFLIVRLFKRRRTASPKNDIILTS